MILFILAGRDNLALLDCFLLTIMLLEFSHSTGSNCAFFPEPGYFCGSMLQQLD